MTEEPFILINFIINNISVIDIVLACDIVLTIHILFLLANGLDSFADFDLKAQKARLY